MADLPFRPLASASDLEEALTQSERRPVLLYKHSTACPISARTQHSLEDLTQDADPPVYRLVVQEAGDLSQSIAKDLGIRHESPQAILLVDRAPVFDTSHGRVKAEAVREAARSHRP